MPQRDSMAVSSLKQKWIATALMAIATIVVVSLFWKRAPLPKRTRPLHDVIVSMRPGRLTNRFEQAAQTTDPIQVRPRCTLLVIGDVDGTLGTMPVAIVEIKKFPWKDDGTIFSNAVAGISSRDDAQHYEIIIPAPQEIGRYIACVRWGKDPSYVASAVLDVTD